MTPVPLSVSTVPVDIILAVCGYVKVEDDVHVRDVEAAARHVCGQQDGAGLGLELVQARQPLVLRHLSVQGNGVEPCKH